MVNEEKVKQMTKLAIYETTEGKKTLPVNKFYRWDYVSMQMVRTFIYSTAGFLLLAGGLAVYRMEELFDVIQLSEWKDMALRLLLYYFIWEAFFLFLTFFLYSYRYIKGKRSVKGYYMELKKLNEMYKEEKRDPWG